MSIDHFKKQLLYTLSLLVCLLPAIGFAKLQTTVSSKSIELGESFTLLIKSDDPNNFKQPKTSILEIDFDVLGINQSTSYSSINGKSSSSKNWNITLTPKKQGELVIPQIQVGNDVTKSITITVYPPGTHKNQTEYSIFTKVDAGPALPYIGEQVIYTIKVYIPEDLQTDNLSLTPPTVANAHIVQLDKDLRYKAVSKGERYQVLERRYAIFPEQSGNVTIDGALLSGTKFVKTNQNDAFSIMSDPFFNSILFQESKPFRLPVEKIEFKVTPKDSHYPVAAAWLPAEEIGLLEDWSNDKLETNVGEPITRTITLSATGLTAEQLPQLNLNLPDSLKQYPSSPKLDTIASVSGVTGTRTEKYAFIATKPGKIKLPEIELLWWNKKEHKTELATLPARTITILPIANASDAVKSGIKSLFTDESDASASAASDGIKELDLNTQDLLKKYLPWGVAILFALLWLITLLGKANPSSPSSKTKAESKAQNLQPFNGFNITKLKKACEKNDGKNAEIELIKFANKIYPKQTTHSLTTIIEINQHEADVRTAILELEKYLYNPAEGKQWHGSDFWGKINVFLKSKPARSTQKNNWEPLNY